MTPTLVEHESEIVGLARRARQAAHCLARVPYKIRCEALAIGMALMEERKREILEANERDCAIAEAKLAKGELSFALFQRLKTSEAGIAHMIRQVGDVMALPDPLDQSLSITELDDNLILEKTTCPIGVLGIVFESRPDIIPQVVALAIMSGNSLLLKGGTEARQTNQVLVTIWRDSLVRLTGFPLDSINLLHSREDVQEMLHLDRYIDLIIPRGSRDFVRDVAKHSTVPVLGHGEGLCHIYVDRSADLQKAWDIVFDSKTQYPAACNSVETLLVHETVAPDFLPKMIETLRCAGVEVRGCARSIVLLADLTPATEMDWETEYSNLVISVKIVSNCDEALEHIEKYGSRHTECIVTEDQSAAQEFLQRVDAASVFQNASTRFADGYRYGFGAELGISTSKLHARGPVGLDGLITYKYWLIGNGQIVATYTSGRRNFKHESLSQTR